LGFVFVLNSFYLQDLLSASACLKMYNCTQPDFVRYIRIGYNEDLLICSHCPGKTEKENGLSSHSFLRLCYWDGLEVPAAVTYLSHTYTHSLLLTTTGYQPEGRKQFVVERFCEGKFYFRNLQHQQTSQIF
jgi:hypothetical protein